MYQSFPKSYKGIRQHTDKTGDRPGAFGRRLFKLSWGVVVDFIYL